MKRISLAPALIVAALALALSGCGSTGSSIAQNANNDVSQAKLVEIATNISIAESSSPDSLPELTNEYVAAVQDAVSVIGSDQARQKLTDMAAQIAPHCSTCAQSLDAAAAQIPQ
jgi:uncharacterized FlgJ-related protein